MGWLVGGWAGGKQDHPPSPSTQTDAQPTPPRPTLPYPTLLCSTIPQNPLSPFIHLSPFPSSSSSSSSSSSLCIHITHTLALNTCLLRAFPTFPSHPPLPAATCRLSHLRPFTPKPRSPAHIHVKHRNSRIPASHPSKQSRCPWYLLNIFLLH